MIETLASEKITVSTVAIGLTGANLTSQVTQVTIRCEGAIRYWTGGKAPTSTDGILTVDKENIVLQRTQAQNLKMIRTGASDIAVQVEYQRDNQQRSAT